MNKIALGCMGLSGAYGKIDAAQSIAVIHAAIERGVTFLDTGDHYGSGHNELLIGKAIADIAERRAPCRQRILRASATSTSLVPHAQGVFSRRLMRVELAPEPLSV